MPNYARQSCLDLDEMFGDYIKDAGNAAAMMRNIRTKERMNSAHHCEDRECCGSPSTRCISALHFCWCVAPVIDEDKKSDTYSQVVICGQRFQCISPKGCAVHTYLDGFNLDIRDARNNYPSTEVKWKVIFEAFRAKHDAVLASQAERQKHSSKRDALTEHQKKRQLKLQDKAAFRKLQKLREQELAAARQHVDQEIDRGVDHRPAFIIVAGSRVEEISSRDRDTAVARERDSVGGAAELSALQVTYRASPTVVSVELTRAIKNGDRSITRVPGNQSEPRIPENFLPKMLSAEATSTLVISPRANHSEPLPAPTDDVEVEAKQAAIETPATRLRLKDAKEAKRPRIRVNKKEDTKETAEEDVKMSETRTKGRKGVKSGKTGVREKTITRGKAGRYTPF